MDFKGVRCYAYCRLSKSDERKDTGRKLESLEHQKRDAQNFCEEVQAVLVRLFEDLKSGKSIKGRKGFLEMISLIEKGNVDNVQVILVSDLDRFSRSTMDTLDTLTKLKRYGVLVYSIDEGDVLDPEDPEIVRQAQEAEMYVRRLRRRTKIRMERAVKDGRHVFPPPYGYKSHDGEWVVIEAEASRVKRVFELALDAKSAQAIAQEVGLHPKMVSRILQNEAYTGKMVYHDIHRLTSGLVGHRERKVYPGRHKPLVSEETFQKVAIITRDRRRALPSAVARILNSKST